MFGVARYCTRISSLSRGPVVGQCNGIARASILPSPSNIRTNNSMGLVSMIKTPTLFPQVQALYRQTGTLAVRYASEVRPKSPKIVGTWMLTCGGMVFVAVALGGITRLTESGLSMVTWNFMGEKMPTSQVQWVREFERYKAFPEYKIKNTGMELDEFKRIWQMEYLHRMWGRLIGASFVLPAAYFWSRGMFTSMVKKRVLVLGSLIGIQGLMGWYMVKSGLENRFDGPSDVPRVSQYRLASHLGLALVIYGGLIYSSLDLLLPAKKPTVDYFGEKLFKWQPIAALVRLKKLVYGIKGLIFVTAISGAFVAGLDAGLIYNTFPKMANKWVPDDILSLSPSIRNFTENSTTVQFDHRLLGISTVSMITLMAWMSRKHKLPGRGSSAVLAVLCAGYLQVILGVTTLLHHVPVPLAALHQSGSLVLFSSILWLCHELKHVKKILK